MKPAFYKNKWARLKEKADKDNLNHLVNQIALSFLDHYFYNDHHDDGYIHLLCEIATFFDDDELNKIGSSVLFGIIIEALCDDFEELQTEAYNRVICRVISFCRTIPTGKELDKRLKHFELKSYEDLFNRIENIRACSDEYRKIESSPDKIILLSRVTIGADVAITSVLIQRLHHMFPESEIIVIGSHKLYDIFGGNPHVRIKQVNYSRRGNLVERFASWFAVLEAVSEEFRAGISANIFVVDPDSRLSQLGVLPFVDSKKYLFFNSRGKDSYPKKMSISELANHWLDNVLGEMEFCYPMVWLQESKLNNASRFATVLRKAGCRKIIVANFGVGENSRKRLGGDFEEKLILKLLDEPETVIVLDQGLGHEELERSKAIIKKVEEHGFTTRYGEFDSLDGINISRGIVGVVSGIGEIAALISQCDEFIGYDSACQHIAASLGIPTYTIFAGSNNARFIRRWSACGPAKSKIIHVDTLTHPPMFDTEDIITRIIDSRSE
ncbi:MAG: hypothetical protein JRJ82_17235 [Deltaproteobacteria bacterium]|nr:hypothetical protein [Deltaproteobacteria bacterium]MBW1900631.1 hypothetical protein [Deltaproteobacteria bacterium]